MIVNNKQCLKRFIQIYEQCGGKVSGITTHLIHQALKDDRVTIEDAERGLVEAFKQEQFFNFANVMKHIKEKPFDSVKARQFYNAKPD